MERKGVFRFSPVASPSSCNVQDDVCSNCQVAGYRACLCRLSGRDCAHDDELGRSQPDILRPQKASLRVVGHRPDRHV